MATEHYYLKKDREGCTGMFWRADPAGGILTRAPTANWPRDGAELKGTVVDSKKGRYLKCSEIKQEGGDWKSAPDGAYMPFRHAQYYLEKA